MEKVRVLNNLWDIPKMLYGLGDFKSPFPVSFEQIGYFLFIELIMYFIRNIFHIYIVNFTMHWIAFPIFLTWFVSKSSLDGKKPYRFFKRYFEYLFKERGVFYRYKKVNTITSYEFNNCIVIRGEDEEHGNSISGKGV